MKKVLTTLSIVIIGIGVIGFALNTVFGMQTISYMTLENVNGVWMYKYDIWNYIENLRNNFEQIAELSITIPDLTWSNTDNLTVDMVKNLQVIANIILFGLNILLYPLRIAFYIIKTVLAIIGLPMADADTSGNPLNWLIQLCKTMTTLQLGYIEIL